MTVERIVPETNAWMESYASHAARYNFFEPLYADKTILDAACGVGYGTAIIARAGATHVTGIDISADALGVATRDFAMENIRFLKANCTELPFEAGSFDLVSSFETAPPPTRGDAR